MPELPDLEAYRRNLEPLLLQQQIAEATLYQQGRPQQLDELRAARLVALERNGKELLFAFDNGRVLAVHLMLQGRIDLVSEGEEVRHKILALKFAERSLVVSDPRGWAKVRLDPEKPAAPDALAPEFTVGYFWEKLKEAKTRNIKAVLVDQEVVRGIGNAYADEILWEARIAPESLASHLPEEAVQALYAAIGSVLKRSVEEILAIDPKVINGEIRDFMRVHHRGKKSSPGGFPIKTKEIGRKKSYYTEEQVLYT